MPALGSTLDARESFCSQGAVDASLRWVGLGGRPLLRADLASRCAGVLHRIPVSRPVVFPPALHEQLAVYCSAMRHPRYGVHVANVHPYATRWGATPGSFRGIARLGAHGRVLHFHGCIFLAGANMLLHAPAARTPSVSRPRMRRSLWPRNMAVFDRG